MTRRQSSKANPQPAEKIEKEETKVEETSPSAPANIEVEASEEPVEAPAAPEPEKLQTDFREKLTKKEEKENPFVPSNPAALEKAAAEVAEEKGFELNRGTSIGARLLARARAGNQ